MVAGIKVPVMLQGQRIPARRTKDTYRRAAVDIGGENSVKERHEHGSHITLDPLIKDRY